MPKRYFGHAIPHSKTITHERTAINMDGLETAPAETDSLFSELCSHKTFNGTIYGPKRSF